MSDMLESLGCMIEVWPEHVWAFYEIKEAKEPPKFVEERLQFLGVFTPVRFSRKAAADYLNTLTAGGRRCRTIRLSFNNVRDAAKNQGLSGIVSRIEGKNEVHYVQ